MSQSTEWGKEEQTAPQQGQIELFSYLHQNDLGKPFMFFTGRKLEELTWKGISEQRWGGDNDSVGPLSSSGLEIQTVVVV